MSGPRGPSPRAIAMRKIHCRIKAHFDSASQSHSRWFSWGQLPEAMQRKAVRRLGLLALFVAGASAAMFLVFGTVLVREHARFKGLYGGSGFGTMPPILVTAQILVSLTVFDGTTPIKKLLLHTNEPTPPLSERVECALPAALERIVLRCLSKAPEDRHQSVAELDAALAELDRDETCRWTTDQANRWWEKHPAMPGDLADEEHTSSVAPTVPMESTKP